MSYDEDALAGRLLLKNCLEILGTAQALLGRSGSNEVNPAMAQARPLIDTANVHLSDALSLLVRGDPMSPAAADDPSDGSMVWTVALAAANLRSSGVEAAQRRQSREMSVETVQSINSSQDSPDLPGDSSVELAEPDCPPPQAPASAAPPEGRREAFSIIAEPPVEAPVQIVRTSGQASGQDSEPISPVGRFLNRASSMLSRPGLRRATKASSKAFNDEATLRRRQDSAWRDKASRAQEAFIFFDEDGSGNLDADELKAALVMIGIDPAISEECVARLMDTIDDDHTNSVDMKEFVEFFTRDLSHDPVLLSIQNAFNQITDDMVEEFNKRSEGMVVGNDRNLIDPRSRLSTDWDIYVAVLLIVTIFTMPLSMAFFDIQRDLQPLDLLADVTFLLDILKHFNTGYMDEFEIAIMDRAKVRWNYASTWFVPDLLSSVPIEILDLILTSGGEDGAMGNFKATKALKLLRLSRIAKVFRILKLSKLSKVLQGLQDDFEDYYQVQLDEASIAMFRLFLSLLVLAHWVGCINFMIAREFDFPEDSWVAHADLVDAAASTQYSWCFFKALMTMIGLGFESPPLVNTVCTERSDWCTIEHWITLICLYIGSIFYALLISSVSYVMSNMNKGGTALADQVWALNEYLRSKKIPVRIRDKCRSFYRIRYAEGKLYDESDILSTLPPQIKDEIVAYNHRVLFEQVPLFSSKAPESFLVRLAPHLDPRLYFAAEIIFEEDMMGVELFFIESGIVQIYSKHQDAVVKSIADGCYFGDVGCLLPGGRRTASTQARTNVVVHVVHKRFLASILTDYGDLASYLVRIAENRRKRLALLDESIVDHPPLAESELNDDEDCKTKYFLKLEQKMTHRNSMMFNINNNTRAHRSRRSSERIQELNQDLRRSIRRSSSVVDEIKEEEGGSGLGILGKWGSFKAPSGSSNTSKIQPI